MREKGAETSFTKPQVSQQKLGPVVGKLSDGLVSERRIVQPVEGGEGVEG